MVFAAGVFAHGAGGAAGLDGVGVVAVEVLAGAADAGVFPVVRFRGVLVHSVGMGGWFLWG